MIIKEMTRLRDFNITWDGRIHRIITVIEPQSPVVFGCTALLLTMVGQLLVLMIGKRGGIKYYL